MTMKKLDCHEKIFYDMNLNEDLTSRINECMKNSFETKDTF